MSDGAHPADRRVRELPIWNGPVDAEALSGGITNLNFRVRDSGGDFFVRVGEDNPIHLIQRAQEHAATRAAHAAGLAPEVVHTEDGILVLRFVQGRTLDESDVRDPEVLRRLVPVILRCHHEIPKHLRGPALMFWVFHAVRHYAGELRDRASPYADRLPELLAKAAELESVIGRVEIVFGHNDLLPANFIDDGERMYILDFEYSGMNDPLWDIGDLSVEAGLSREQDLEMLRAYLGGEPSEAQYGRMIIYKAMCDLLWTLWGLIQYAHGNTVEDFWAYSTERFARCKDLMNRPEFSEHVRAVRENR